MPAESFYQTLAITSSTGCAEYPSKSKEASILCIALKNIEDYVN